MSAGRSIAAACAALAIGLGASGVASAEAERGEAGPGRGEGARPVTEIALIERAGARLDRAIRQHRRERAERRERRREARERRAELAVPDLGGVDPATLEAIAACESGGDPGAVNPAGYYGKYQFDLGTWRSVGGSGNPADAPEAEQDTRAAILYSRAGSSPWPLCGA